MRGTDCGKAESRIINLPLQRKVFLKGREDRVALVGCLDAGEQQFIALRQQLRVNLADLGDRAVVDMRDEARDRVKYLIIVVIDAPEEIGGKLSGHTEILFDKPVDSVFLC